MDIIRDQDSLESFPLVRSFHNAYTEPSHLSGCAALVKEGADMDPDNTALVTVRSFIEDTKETGSQKYIIGFRGYSFGNMATIDLVSLDRESHRDIAYEHVERMEWPLADNVSRSGKFESTYHSPFAFTGGYVERKNDELLHFHGASSDYTDYLLWSQANHAASFIAGSLGAPVKGSTKKGEQFIEELLEFLQQHKLSDDFYEQLAVKSFDDGDRITGQQMSALLTMKSADRVMRDGGDFQAALIDEMTGNFSSRIMVANIARRMESD